MAGGGDDGGGREGGGDGGGRLAGCGLGGGSPPQMARIVGLVSHCPLDKYIHLPEGAKSGEMVLEAGWYNL